MEDMFMFVPIKIVLNFQYDRFVVAGLNIERLLLIRQMYHEWEVFSSVLICSLALLLLTPCHQCYAFSC